MHLGAKQPHPVYIWFLAVDIFCAHKDFTFHIEQRAGCCGSNPMLACAGLGNNFGLAHFLGKQCLTQHIIDFMRACVV